MIAVNLSSPLSARRSTRVLRPRSWNKFAVARLAADVPRHRQSPIVPLAVVDDLSLKSARRKWTRNEPPRRQIQPGPVRTCRCASCSRFRCSRSRPLDTYRWSARCCRCFGTFGCWDRFHCCAAGVWESLNYFP